MTSPVSKMQVKESWPSNEFQPNRQLLWKKYRQEPISGLNRFQRQHFLQQSPCCWHGQPVRKCSLLQAVKILSPVHLFFKRFWAGFQIPPTWRWGGGGNFSNTCRFLDKKIKRSSCRKLEIFLQQPKNWINRHKLSLYLLLIKLISSLKLSKIFPI